MVKFKPHEILLFNINHVVCILLYEEPCYKAISMYMVIPLHYPTGGLQGGYKPVEQGVTSIALCRQLVSLSIIGSPKVFICASLPKSHK